HQGLTVVAAETDNYLPASATVYINVLSAEQQAALMTEQVNALVAAGVLNSGNGNALTVKLELTGNKNADIGRVNAFINQLTAFVRARKLTQEQAAPLFDAANALLLSLSLS